MQSLPLVVVTLENFLIANWESAQQMAHAAAASPRQRNVIRPPYLPKLKPPTRLPIDIPVERNILESSVWETCAKTVPYGHSVHDP